MAKILVTGANGFLGRYAVEALQRAGWQVAVSGRRAPVLDGVCQSVAMDLLQPLETRDILEQVKADVLLHLAWFDDPRSRWHSVSNLTWTSATLDLIEKFAATGGKRVVFGSSCAVYEFSARNIHTETDRLAPTSLYGAAKAATANLLMTAQHALGISFVEARIFFCYGSGEPAGRLVADLITGISKGQSVACTDGMQLRDYLHASDVGGALQTLAASDCTGPVNVASGSAIRVSELITEVAAQMGRAELPEFGAIPRMDADPPNITGSADRLAGLGFRPKHNLASGVAETLSRSRLNYL